MIERMHGYDPIGPHRLDACREDLRWHLAFLLQRGGSMNCHLYIRPKTRAIEIKWRGGNDAKIMHTIQGNQFLDDLLYNGRYISTTTHGVIVLFTAIKSFSSQLYCRDPTVMLCSELSTTVCTSDWSKEYLQYRQTWRTH